MTLALYKASGLANSFFGTFLRRVHAIFKFIKILGPYRYLKMFVKFFLALVLVMKL